MKKNKLLTLSVLCFLFIGLVSLTGCEDNAKPTPDTNTEYTVTFDAGTGGTLTSAATVKVKEGEKVAKPTDPTRDGFSFSGWQDADSKTFDFNTAIAADITLTAGWKAPGAVSNVVIELNTAARPTEFRVASYVYTDGDGTVVPNSTAEVKWFASDNSDGSSATEVATGATYSPVGVDRYKFVSASVRVKSAENGYTPEEKSTTSLFAGFSTKATGSTNKFTARSNAGAVKFNGKMWVIGGARANATTLDEVWSSSDGATWTQETLTSSFGARRSHTVLSFNDTIWVIGGNGSGPGSGDLDDVWSSEDGVKWTRVAEHAAFAARYNHTSVVFNNKMWVIAGQRLGIANVSFSDVWSSSDGVTWAQSTIPSDAGFSARQNHTSVVHDGKMWIIGGVSNGTFFDDVWSSSDGTNWTQSAIPSGSGYPARSSHTSVAYDGKIWVIGGVSSDSSTGIVLSISLNDVWSSSDGATWKRALEQAGFPARSAHTSVLFDNKIFVLGGNGDNQGILDDVWY